LHLGSEFYAWDASKLQVNETAKAYLIPLKKED
jgi:hypothetical protein